MTQREQISLAEGPRLSESANRATLFQVRISDRQDIGLVLGRWFAGAVIDSYCAFFRFPAVEARREPWIAASRFPHPRSAGLTQIKAPALKLVHPSARDEGSRQCPIDRCLLIVGTPGLRTSSPARRLFLPFGTQSSSGWLSSMGIP